MSETWILVGKVSTEPIEDGEVVERFCGACGQDAKFSEHEGPRGQRVMVCSECGVAFRIGQAEERTASIDEAVDRASEAAIPLWERASEAAKDALELASEGLGPLAKKAGEALDRIKENAKAVTKREEPDEDEDPEKADLLRRFAELEKKMKDRG